MATDLPLPIRSIYCDFMDCIINGQCKRMKFSGTVQGLLDKLNISEQIVLVKLNGEIVTELDKVNENDKVEIQKVILGG